MPLPALQDYAPIFPEIFLAVSAMLLLMYGVFAGDSESEVPGWVGIFILIATGFFVVNQGNATVQLADGAVIVDPFARFMKLLILAGSVFALILSFDYLRDAKILKFEFPVLVLLSTFGMMLMASANNLISLYLALELQSLALYVLAAFRRDSVFSAEAGLKYFVLGALSSGLLLYGCSLVYGFTGTTSFTGIAAVLQGPERSIGLIFGLVFILSGIAFKLSAVPFHMWTPDVYQGAPTPVTAFFAAGPKVAAFAMLIRVVLDAFPAAATDWKQIVIAISVGSMALGAFAAIGQINIKRLMAYSSIGHVGYALVGLSTGTPEGIQGVLIYLAIYVPMTLGTFACILAMRRGGNACRGHRRTVRLVAAPAYAGFHACHIAVFHGGHSAAGRFLRQILRVSGGDPIGSVLAGGGRRRHLGDQRLLLSGDHLQNVLPGTGGGVRADDGKTPLRTGSHGHHHLVPVHPAQHSGDGRRRRRQVAVLGPPRCTMAASTCRADTAWPSTRASTPPMPKRSGWRRQGEAGGLWIWAGTQQSGRGRAGRGWASPAGNLHASLLLRPRVPLATALQLSLLAGVAAHDAVSALAAGAGVAAGSG